MAEVKVTREQSLAKRETLVPSAFFGPMFPFGRYFGFGPFGLMRELSGEMGAFRGVIPSTQLEPWTPTVDVQQSNGDLVVTAELPGLKKEDVKVELTDEPSISK